MSLTVFSVVAGFYLFFVNLLVSGLIVTSLLVAKLPLGSPLDASLLIVKFVVVSLGASSLMVTSKIC